jgi:hypothetical protein
MNDIPARARSKRSIKHIFSSIVLLLIVLVVGAHFIWGIWAAHRLDTALAALHAEGEPVTYTELKLDSVPDAQNASLDYLAAGDLIDTSTPAWTEYDRSDSYNFSPPLTDSERATVRKIVQENTAALARVTAARGKLPGGWKDWLNTPDMLTQLPHLNGVRTLANLLRFAAMDAHLHGDDQLSLQWVKDELSQAEAAEHRPLIIGHLVAIGCDELTSNTIAHLAPDLHVASNHLARQDIVNLLHPLQDESAINNGDKLAWRSERIAAINTMQKLAAGGLSVTSISTAGSSTLSWHITGYVLKPLLLTDARLYANYLQDVIVSQTAPDWSAAQKQLSNQLPVKVDQHRFQHIYLSLMMTGTQKAGLQDYQVKSWRRLATVALAVRLFAADHHDQIPTSLADLVPFYLPAIPMDAMTGTPLHYKSDPPRVYAVGTDGVDHGGVPQDSNSNDAVVRHHGDLVIYLVTPPRKMPK